jgi:hypothetical protein
MAGLTGIAKETFFIFQRDFVTSSGFEMKPYRDRKQEDRKER